MINSIFKNCLEFHLIVPPTPHLTLPRISTIPLSIPPPLPSTLLCPVDLGAVYVSDDCKKMFSSLAPNFFSENFFQPKEVAPYSTQTLIHWSIANLGTEITSLKTDLLEQETKMLPYLVILDSVSYSQRMTLSSRAIPVIAKEEDTRRALLIHSSFNVFWCFVHENENDYFGQERRWEDTTVVSGVNLQFSESDRSADGNRNVRRIFHGFVKKDLGFVF